MRIDMFRNRFFERFERPLSSCAQVKINQIVKFTINKGDKKVNMTGKATSNSNHKTGAVDVTANGKKYLLVWLSNNTGWIARK